MVHKISANNFLEGPSQTSMKKEDASLTTGLLSETNKNVMNIEQPLAQSTFSKKICDV